MTRGWQSLPWTPAEDRLLREFAEKCLPWMEITGLFPNRSVSACQTRWNNYVRVNCAVNPRRRLDSNKAKAEQSSAKGPAIAGDHYTFSVPEGDPLLQRLKHFHGKDRIYRNVDVRPQTATRRTWPQELANVP